MLQLFGGIRISSSTSATYILIMITAIAAANNFGGIMNIFLANRENSVLRFR